MNPGVQNNEITQCLKINGFIKDLAYLKLSYDQNKSPLVLLLFAFCHMSYNY